MQVFHFVINHLKSIVGLDRIHNVNGLAQDCSNSIANALELLQSCAKPSTCISIFRNFDGYHWHVYMLVLVTWSNSIPYECDGSLYCEYMY